MRLLYSAIAVVFLTCLALSSIPKAEAATLTGVSDTITTSRPSASSPLNAALSAADTQAIIFNNGSRFLASDSAKIIKSATGAVVDAATVVSSQSGALTTVFFGEQVGTAAHAAADVLYVPITAMHKIRFTAVTEIPTDGDLEIIFPTLRTGDADNDASPSASTFQFNDLVPGGSETNPTNIEVYNGSSAITANVTVTETEPSSGNPGRITIEFDSGPIAAGSVITVFLGCSAASDENTCTAQVPRVINPTKSAVEGTADIWRLRLTTENASDVEIDNATLSIGTIETVQVLATVDPSLTFTIGGVANNTTINSTYTACTGNTDITNTGISATATVVNMGVVSSLINIAAQELTVATNAPSGYTLTATSSAPLRDLSSGHSFITDSSLPGSTMTAGNEFFGIHPCGVDVDTDDWGSGATGGGTGNRYAWPHDGANASTLTLASHPGVANSIETLVEYAVTASAITPAGLYQAFITYIATPTF